MKKKTISSYTKKIKKIPGHVGGGAAALGVGVGEQVPVLGEAHPVQQESEVLLQSLHVQHIVRPEEIIRR